MKLPKLPEPPLLGAVLGMAVVSHQGLTVELHQDQAPEETVQTRASQLALRMATPHLLSP